MIRAEEQALHYQILDKLDEIDSANADDLSMATNPRFTFSLLSILHLSGIKEKSLM